MRHSYFGKKLSRTKNERRRLLMILARELIKHGKITTTLAKARAVQPLVEKLVTRAKAGTTTAKQQMFKVLADQASVALLLGWAGNRFATRGSGYTRIVRLGSRRGDATEAVLLSFVDMLPARAPEIKKEVVKPQKTEEPVKKAPSPKAGKKPKDRK